MLVEWLVEWMMMVILDLLVEWLVQWTMIVDSATLVEWLVECGDRVMVKWWRWRYSTRWSTDVIEWCDRVTLRVVLDHGVEWWLELVKSPTRPGGRVLCWGRGVSTRPEGQVVWHDHVLFFQLARQQLQITWKQHKYAICMQNYPKHAKWWQMI